MTAIAANENGDRDTGVLHSCLLGWLKAPPQKILTGPGHIHNEKTNSNGIPIFQL